jgi:hypothetical protein
VEPCLYATDSGGIGINTQDFGGRYGFSSVHRRHQHAVDRLPAWTVDGSIEVAVGGRVVDQANISRRSRQAALALAFFPPSQG